LSSSSRRKIDTSPADESGVDPVELDRLVDAARTGDPAAFSAIWTALGGRVHGYFRAHGCRDAEDLTSETFLAAFARIGDVVGDGAAFRTWLFSIAHHKRVDEVRRRSRQPAAVPYEPDLDRRLSGPADEPGSAAERGDVLGMLADLAPDQREVLTLRFVADLSLDEVATTLGRSVGAIKSLQHRALETLRRRVDEPSLQGRSGEPTGQRVSLGPRPANAET
jgi:RNA polymerase sigma-70 factor, ECF subfamily